MDLPINHKDLKTIVNALALGGDTRLYFLLKNVVDNERLEQERKLEIVDTNVQVYSESDDYPCKQGQCDI